MYVPHIVRPLEPWLGPHTEHRRDAKFRATWSTTLDDMARAERLSWQTDIFDHLDEDGDPDGCSPYGCRSGPRHG